VICDTEFCNADEIDLSNEEADNSSNNVKSNLILLITFGFISKLLF